MGTGEMDHYSRGAGAEPSPACARDPLYRLNQIYALAMEMLKDSAG